MEKTSKEKKEHYLNKQYAKLLELHQIRLSPQLRLGN